MHASRSARRVTTSVVADGVDLAERRRGQCREQSRVLGDLDGDPLAADESREDEEPRVGLVGPGTRWAQDHSPVLAGDPDAVRDELARCRVRCQRGDVDGVRAQTRAHDLVEELRRPGLRPHGLVVELVGSSVVHLDRTSESPPPTPPRSRSAHLRPLDRECQIRPFLVRRTLRARRQKGDLPPAEGLRVYLFNTSSRADDGPGRTSGNDS